MSKLALYARTVRFLTWRQLAYRALRPLQRQLAARRSEDFPPSVMNQTRMARVVVEWGPGKADKCMTSADAILGGRFVFLNVGVDLPAVDWLRRYVSHLWNYNLHYFAYAVDLAWAYRLTGSRQYASRFIDLARDWIRQTEGRKGDGWQPYAVSVRIVNWVYALLLLDDAVESYERTELLRSLSDQLSFLRHSMEHDLLGNHLQKNFMAMAVGSLTFDGDRPLKWQAWAARGLWQTLRTQILADGGHFERSPMYHAIALADFMESIQLLEVCGQAIPGEVRETVGKMRVAYDTLARENGRIHLFNDSAYGVAPEKSRLDALGHVPASKAPAHADGLLQLPDTGYYGFNNPGTGDRILIDCGAPGPRVQPGHAHCDALSFELDLNGSPVVVDSGVHGYDGDPFREYVRSTRAHNTVMVNGREQSEIWGTFRLARRISGISASQSFASGGYRFAGEYRPYHARSILHHRTITGRGRQWEISDTVTGPGIARVESFIHFHPDLTAEITDETTIILRGRGQRIQVSVFGADRLQLARGTLTPVQGWYCPEFGRAIENYAAMLSRGEGQAAFGYCIEVI